MSKDQKRNYISLGFGITNSYIVPFAIGLAVAYLISTMVLSRASGDYTFTYTPQQSNADAEALLKGDRASYAQLVLGDNIFDAEVGIPVVEEEVVEAPRASYTLVGLIYNPEQSFAFIKDNSNVFFVSTTRVNPDISCMIQKATQVSITLDCDGKVETIELEGAIGGGVASSGSASASASTSAKKPAKEKGTVAVITTTSPIPSSGAKITVTDSGVNVEVGRKYVNDQLSDVNKIFTTTRIAPKYNNDEFVGYSILGFGVNSPLQAIGLQRGDVIVRINGASTNNPTALYGLVGDADNIDSLTIEVIRSGRKQTIFVSVTG